MKTNEAQDGAGELKREFWQLWADYFMRFFDLYKEQGIEFWGLTTGNEPSLAFFTWTGINSIGWLPWTLVCSLKIEIFLDLKKYIMFVEQMG